MTRICVIIPAYNASATLTETLDSILRQTLQPNEVIVSDDGSTDETRELARAHPINPRVLELPHAGATIAVNAGVAVARGEYLAFLDADDLWEPRKLELQCECLDGNSRLDLVLGHTENFICPTLSEADASRLAFPTGVNPGFLQGCMLVRKDCWDRVGTLDESLQTGWFIDWFSRAKSAGVSYEMLPELVLRRRVRPNSLGRRTQGGQNRLTRDFLRIARASIKRKRQMESVR